MIISTTRVVATGRFTMATIKIICTMAIYAMITTITLMITPLRFQTQIRKAALMPVVRIPQNIRKKDMC